MDITFVYRSIIKSMSYKAKIMVSRFFLFSFFSLFLFSSTLGLVYAENKMALTVQSVLAVSGLQNILFPSVPINRC